MFVKVRQPEKLPADAIVHLIEYQLCIQKQSYLRSRVQMAGALEARFPGRVLLIRYEDLSTSTEAMTRSMLNFLDLPWTTEMSSYIETHTSADEPKLTKSKVCICATNAHCSFI